MVDLFDNPDLIPPHIMAILSDFEAQDPTYETCNNLIKELNKHGYTCDYGLDASPYHLTKLKTKD